MDFFQALGVQIDISAPALRFQTLGDEWYRVQLLPSGHLGVDISASSVWRTYEFGCEAGAFGSGC